MSEVLIENSARISANCHSSVPADAELECRETEPDTVEVL
jgi:hypothetical protein